ncbi:TVP38/TMEM64 family protein [Pseudomonas sp. PMCC200344]|uniref:TVP38/TMEM64 family protein n=1 Tax=Pseudomonas sp. PMCC200344 TaxID=3042028 RepID=UPI0024B3B050|nr:TVP38/TMEM64 family protein [Pseudomonas sp. PMCC200344]
MVMNQVASLIDVLRAYGSYGAILFATLYLLATLAFMPASPLTAIAGFLYGPLWGTLLVLPVAVVSATLAFFITRYMAGPWARRYLDRKPRLAAVDQAVARDGFRIVLLLRLSSIVPFAPLSYTLGASSMRGHSFALASLLGLLPGTFLYAYLGSLVSDVAQLIRGEVPVSSYSHWLSWGGLVAALLALWIIARFARQAIRQSTVEGSNDEQAV